MRAQWRKDEWVLRVLYFREGGWYTFFMAYVTIWSNSLKCFAVRAVGNALQQQISVNNVVSKLNLSQLSKKAAFSVYNEKQLFPSGISLRSIHYVQRWRLRKTANSWKIKAFSKLPKMATKQTLYSLKNRHFVSKIKNAYKHAKNVSTTQCSCFKEKIGSRKQLILKK